MAYETRSLSFETVARHGIRAGHNIVASGYRPDAIITVYNSGAVPAQFLMMPLRIAGYEFDELPMVARLDMRADPPRLMMRAVENTMLHLNRLAGNGKGNILIIDDTAITGITLGAIRHIMKRGLTRPENSRYGGYEHEFSLVTATGMPYIVAVPFVNDIKALPANADVQSAVLYYSPTTSCTGMKPEYVFEEFDADAVRFVPPWKALDVTPKKLAALHPWLHDELYPERSRADQRH